MTSSPWIVCQIGAREHYAIPRALAADNKLAGLITDYWVEPNSWLTPLPGTRRLKDRYHPELRNQEIHASNFSLLICEIQSRCLNEAGWRKTIKHNNKFQQRALRQLEQISAKAGEPITLFSYSYAALELFRYAKTRGWRTVLGQIDPGPEEERIVQAEHERFPNLGSSWSPAPDSYWRNWREEVGLADRIIVNSEWSSVCLSREEVPPDKIEIVPLVYSAAPQPRLVEKVSNSDYFELLFLGQFNLRKGAARLLDAMRLLKGGKIRLTIAGSSDLPESSWSDLGNVTWIGPVPRSEVAQIYARADAFILPTLSDGFALTQLEAASCSLPLLVSNRCGKVLHQGQSGLLFPDLEAETIAATIRQAATKTDWNHNQTSSFSLRDLGAALID